MEEKGKIGYLSVSAEEFTKRAKILSETFRGEVEDKQIRFPKGLGAEHPFDFYKADKIIDNIGVVNAMVDKIVDAIVGDFNIKVKDRNAQKILDSFSDEAKLKTNLRPWVKEAVFKGNGIIEIDLDDEKIRVMNANHMYVRRNIKSKILGWRQFKGNYSLYTKDSKKIIPFEPKQIAHLTINKKPNDPYGTGLVWSNRVAIENYAGFELDLFKLISRKAGAPIHVTVGQPGETVQTGDIDDFKASLQYMTNSTEWVTDANVKMELLKFDGVGDNLIKAATHALEQIAIGMKIPMSILGIANNPEGLAKINDKGFIRFINSVRAQAEEIIEEKILRPILRKNGLDAKIDFEWEMQDEEDKNKRLDIIIKTLGLFDLSPELRASLEIEYANIVGLDEVKNILLKPSDARKEAETRAREQEEQTIKQPEVPGAKPTANQSNKQEIKEIEIKTKEIETIEPKEETEKSLDQANKFLDAHNSECTCGCNLTESQVGEMTLREYVNLKEIAGFNYTDYLIKILQNLRTEKFEDLRAITENDLLDGLLPNKDIKKLKVILNDGFKKNKTIKQIENDISRSIDLKDRTKLNEQGERVVTLISSSRPNAIARTETVRLANAGLKDMYIENNIKSYRYLAALDDRTSEICSSLNGQVFLIKDGMPGVNMPPLHTNCRSSIVGLVD